MDERGEMPARVEAADHGLGSCVVDLSRRPPIEMLTLYVHNTCPRSQSVRIAFAEMGLAHTEIELAAETRHPPEIVGRTPVPRGVPVLFVRDDFVLWGAASIIYWVTGAHPGSLTPSSLDRRARAIGWVEWAESMLYKPLARLRHRDPSAKRWAEAKLRDLLPELEPMLPHDDTWLEGAFSIADIAMAPPLVAIPPALVSEMPRRLLRYVDRLRHRPSVFRVCELGEEVDGRPSWAA